MHYESCILNKGGKMKISHFFMFNIYCLLVTVFLWGCGDGPGSPGSEGSEDTGIEPRVVSITHSDPAGDQGDLWNIDFIQDLCPDGKPEVYGNDYANIAFHGDQLNPNVISDNILYITNYKVTFLKEDPSSPTIEQDEYGNQAGITILPGADTGPFSFLILDIGKKNAIVNDINSGINIPKNPLVYNMKIEIWGQDRYGKDFKVGPIIRMIDITNYDKCQ
jgi:hypothetical protein